MTLYPCVGSGKNKPPENVVEVLNLPVAAVDQLVTLLLPTYEISNTERHGSAWEMVTFQSISKGFGCLPLGMR